LTPSYPFQHVLCWDIWSSSCSNSIMFWPKGECLAYSSTNLPRFFINFFSLFHNLSNMTWIAPSFNCKYPSMCVHTSHWPYGYLTFMKCSWQQAHMNPWCSSQHLCYHCASFKHVQFLPLRNQHCAHQRWHLHLNRHCHYWPNTNGFTLSILHHPRICCL
jgi:hypothetical protein